jgi:hypothetical protein
MKLANVDQLAAWDGDEGAQWAAHEEHFDGAGARRRRGGRVRLASVVTARR